VGPVWRGGDQGEAALLSACYRNSLRVAEQGGARSIAFPSISTGIYGYPIEAAARLAVATVREALAQHPGIDRVLFCCFSASDLAVYQQALAEQQG